MAGRALLDTSVLIAQESGRPLDADSVPAQTAVSVVTLAELHVGVLAASDTATRARRLATLDAVSALEAYRSPPRQPVTGRRYGPARGRGAKGKDQ